MKKRISQSKLLELLGLSRASIAKWKKAGCPNYKKGKAFDYDVEQLRQWLVKTGKVDYAVKLDAYFGVPITEPKKNSKEPEIKISPSDNADRKELDIFTAKQIVGNLLMAAAKRLKDAATTDIAFETNNISKLTNQLRQLEESCIEIDKLLRKVIPIEEVKTFLNRNYNKVKTNLLALPYSVADQLASMTNAEDIAIFLKVKIEEKLTTLISDIEK